MSIRLSNIRVDISEPERALGERAARLLGLRAEEIERWRILRKSLDVRDKSNIAYVYSLEVSVPNGEAQLIEHVNRRRGPIAADAYQAAPFEMPPCGSLALAERPVIVGSGPAGAFAGYFLAERGYRPIVLERGQAVRERIADMRAFDAGGPHNSESNYLFGEGGAGTFSDGKLTCRASGPDVARVLELFVECKADPSILYNHRPHLGSNRLPGIIKALRRRIEALGGEFRFNCRLEDLDVADGAIRGLVTSSGYVKTSILLLAIGHSARDTYEMLFRHNVAMTPKPFQIGLRIEQPQSIVNRVQYGDSPLENTLGAADYSLVAHGRENVFTFCMCAGGYIMPSVSEAEHFCTNGMSLSRRDSDFANSGLMITLEPSEFGSPHTLAGMMLQRHFEKRAFEIGRGEYLCPIQSVPDFLARRTSAGPFSSSYPRGVIAAELREVIPAVVASAIESALPIMDQRWRGRLLPHSTLVGPEARGSSPVRFVRDTETLESPSARGLYPLGEGAGYAGGIVSAALDGLRGAKAIIRRYAPLEA